MEPSDNSPSPQIRALSLPYRCFIAISYLSIDALYPISGLCLYHFYNMKLLEKVQDATQRECQPAVYSDISVSVIFTYRLLCGGGLVFIFGLFLSLAFSNWIKYSLTSNDGDIFDGNFCFDSCSEGTVMYGYPLQEVLFWTCFYIPHMTNQLLLAGHVSSSKFVLSIHL